MGLLPQLTTRDIGKMSCNVVFDFIFFLFSTQKKSRPCLLFFVVTSHKSHSKENVHGLFLCPSFFSFSLLSSIQILNLVLTLTRVFQVLLGFLFFLCTGITYLQFNRIDYTFEDGLGME